MVLCGSVWFFVVLWRFIVVPCAVPCWFPNSFASCSIDGSLYLARRAVVDSSRLSAVVFVCVCAVLCDDVWVACGWRVHAARAGVRARLRAVRAAGICG